MVGGVAQARVLVVDDNASFLSVIHDFLEDCGYRVLTAIDGESALATLSESVPDIIISDVMMPGIDGVQFQDTVRATPEWSDIPFIFLTALSSPDEVKRGKERGCDDYLTKPFQPDELAAVIKGKITLAKRRKTLSEEKMEVYRRRIIHTLSHEFRTPLVAINTGSELLLDQHESLDRDRMRHLIESIHRGGKRLQNLVNDFMTLQQIDSGNAEKAQQRLRRPIPVQRLIETAVESFHEVLVGKPAKTVLRSAIPPSLSVLVYDVQVIDLFHRLLSNAHKFGDPERATEVSVGVCENSVEVHIRDYGKGMSGKALEDVCQSFNQINRDKLEQQGCGLGLTIASYYASLNGGHLSFDNPEGGGVDAVVNLPLI